jgi:hypothetical protein
MMGLWLRLLSVLILAGLAEAFSVSETRVDATRSRRLPLFQSSLTLGPVLAILNRDGGNGSARWGSEVTVLTIRVAKRCNLYVVVQKESG